MGPTNSLPQRHAAVLTRRADTVERTWPPVGTESIACYGVKPPQQRPMSESLRRFWQDRGLTTLTR
jgi:hypothetical protein